MRRRVTNRIFISCLVLLSPAFVAAEPELGDVALHQALLDVGTDLRLMCVAAHPDDEDGASLSLYRKKYGYKTFAVLTTRGEGGQNEIGPDLYEWLAVLRTHEMAEASKITGAELHFLNMPEFGYSKSREETYELWGENVALERMVRKIREARPDVIITHHPPTGAHGHHQATGKTLQDAFDIAADPNVFPEQMKEGLEPWQPSRLYVRQFRGSGQSIVNDFSELDPARGYTYAQIAAQALREHKTQGMGFFIDRFLSSRSSASYTLVKEAPGTAATGSGPVPPGGPLFQGLKDRVSEDARTLSASGLSGNDLRDAALKHLAGVGKSDRDAWERANRLAVAATGLRLTARIDDDAVVPDQRVTITAEAKDFGTPDAKEITFRLESAPWMPAELPKAIDDTFASDGFANATLTTAIPKRQPPTVPHHEHIFEDSSFKPQLTAVATAIVDGTPLELRAPVLVDVAPTVSVDFIGGPYLIQRGKTTKTRFKVLVTNHTPDQCSALVKFEAASGIQLAQSQASITFAKEGDQKVVPIEATIDPGLKPGDYALNVSISENGYTRSGIARVVDLEIPQDKHIGLVLSYDDTFVTTLERLAVPHETLEIDDFQPDRLDRFTTIIVDIRAYLVRPDLLANNQALLDYAKRGGTVIVMYQKTFEWENGLAPYDLKVGRGRVTREDAPVELLVPDHPLFNTPNRIVAADWDGWRQERGLYFPSSWDRDAYTALVSLSDPGEKPLEGSCLIADYGEGTYFYTALGWYRQLRELHPGAIRTFANMLAL